MQASELDQRNNTYTGDVENINFRPSPNFKHMRKYLKAHASPNQSSDSSTSPPNMEQEQVNREIETTQASTSSMTQPGHPPLPLNSLPLVLVVPKQEIEDEAYNDSASQSPEPKVDAGTNKEKQPEKTMCRQFARGTCTRGSSCIFVHELILTQLPGVYTFCKNFQNTLCKFPMCKFVHATVFEKENFFRTGFLPPHSLAHLKESNSALAPPSTPAEAQAAETTEFMNPPPNMLPGVSALPISGNPPPDVLPLSEMNGPSPRSFPLDMPGRHEVESNGHPEECNKCDITKCRLLVGRQLNEEEMIIAETLRQQKIKQQREDTRLDKLLKYLITNSLFNDGSDGSQDINTIAASFILRELDGQK